MGAIAEGIVAYAQPLLDQTDGSEEQLNKAMTISQLCWNIALLPEEGRNQMLSEIRPSLQMDEDQFEEFRRSIIAPMIRRHQEMFPLMHRRGSTAASSRPATRVISAQKTRVGRNDPCPCGSGNKFKHCCGGRS
jgi:uncharacterized protein YecA (UPF0149 family)